MPSKAYAKLLTRMTITYFTEAVSEAPVKKGNGRWLVAIATPGQGSSGHYSEDMLKEYGPVAFPAGAKSFINHEGSRNPKDMIGTYPEGAYWDDSRKQLMGELQTFSHWQAFVEEVGPHCGMSIYMAGESDTDGNVTKLLEDRQNGADLVSYPGLEGSGLVEQMLESARAGSETPPAALAEDTNDGKDATRMTDEQFTELKSMFADAIATKTAEAQVTAQVEADEAAVAEAVEAFEAASELIDTADLTSAQKKALRAEAKKGSDVAPLIEAAVALKAEILQESGAEVVAGRVVRAESNASFTTPWGAR